MTPDKAQAANPAFVDDSVMQIPDKLMNKNFLLLCNGQVLSSLGSQFSIIALTFWIKHATGSAAIMGSILMVGSIPAVLLGPIAGTFADRFWRRRIIIVCDILNGLATLSLAGVMMSFPTDTSLVLTWLAIVYVFAGTLSCFLQPAITAAIPDVVPEKSIAGANSTAQFLMQGTVFLGQGVGGLLYRILGAPLVFVIDGFSYLVSAVFAGFATIPQVIPEKNSGWKSSVSEFKRDLSGGFVYMWKRTGLRELVCISALLVFFSTPVIVLLPFFVEDVLKLETDWYGYIIAVYGAGSMTGFLLAGVLRLSGKARYMAVMIFIALQSAGYALLGLVRDPLVVMLMAFSGGAAGGFVTINITTVLQLTTPGEFRGRVFAILGTISGALAPVAMGLSGLVADIIGQDIPLIYISCGVALFIVSLWLLVNRPVKNFISQEEGTSASPVKTPSVVKTARLAGLVDAGGSCHVIAVSVTDAGSGESPQAEMQQGSHQTESLEGSGAGQDAISIKADLTPKVLQQNDDMGLNSDGTTQSQSQMRVSKKAP